MFETISSIAGPFPFASAIAFFSRSPEYCRPLTATISIPGPNPALWRRLKEMKVAHLVIETAFSDEERQLASLSRHLCPSALGSELAQLSGSVDVHITHIKPGEMEAVMAEVERLGTPHRIHALTAGQIIHLG